MKMSNFAAVISNFNLQSSMKNRIKYFLLPALLCLLGIAAMAYYCCCTAFSIQDETYYLYIDTDDNVDSVLTKLQPVGREYSLAGLSTMMRHTEYNEHVRTGRYAIEPGMRTYDVLRQLKNGIQTPVMLTIPEVRTMEQLACRLGNKLMIDSADIAPLIVGDTLAPCLFVPDTYEVYWNISAEALMERMKKEHDKFWDSNNRRQLAANHGLTPDEVCTLASIIDEETANSGEKPDIAGMYLNRLRRGMLLQADPTVKFALQDFALRRVLNKHLEAESPYNTYRNAGLPPGPIKIASKEAIDAVLHASQNPFLYMCAKEDFSGTHNFAVSLAEHQKNAARYAKALNERGIK